MSEEFTSNWQETGDFGVHDENGDVVFDEKGKPLLDLDGQHITYDEDGNLENKNVSQEVIEFINNNAM